jgi:hypothetical protein
MSIVATQDSRDALLAYLQESVRTISISKAKYYKGQIDLAYSLNLITLDNLKDLKRQFR